MRMHLRAILLATLCAPIMTTNGIARDFAIPGGDLAAALDAYTQQTGISLIVSGDALKNARTAGAKGELTDEDALSRLLNKTGFRASRDSSGLVAIVPSRTTSYNEMGDSDTSLQLAQAAPGSHAAVETVTVTSSKLGGADVQSIPISITALSQEQLTATQTAGGPDLVKQVPNLTFTKTNFTGYSIQNPWHRHAGDFGDD